MKSESEVAQSCPTLMDPTDCGPPASSVHGIFQARVLEWGAIAVSKAVLIYIAGVQPWLIQGIRSRDGVGEGQDTIASIRY